MSKQRYFKFLAVLTLVIALAITQSFLTQAATQGLSPDSILAITNLSPNNVSVLQDDPDNPQNNDWLTANSAANTSVRVGFPDPAADLETGAGLQEFRVLLRRTNNSGRIPTVTLSLYEGGSLVSTLLSGADVNSAVGTVFSVTWDASALSDISGTDVELLIQGAVTGGPGGERNTVEVGAVLWEADIEDIAPLMATYAPTSVGQISVEGQGEVTNDGGSAITRRGFVVATGTSPLTDPGNQSPEAQSSYQLIYDETSADFGAGSFSLTLSGLSPETDYRYRAFAQNSEGFTYGQDVGFSTAELVPATWREGENTPATVQINETIRLRLQIDNEGTVPDTAEFQLDYASSTAGPWIAVPVDNPNCNSTAEAFRICDSPYIPHNTPTTRQLTDISGSSFISSWFVSDANPAAEVNFQVDEFTELEWVLQVTDSADPLVTYYFRVSNSDGLIGTYAEFPELNITTETPLLTQRDWRWYRNNNARIPTVPWGGLGENTAITKDNDPPMIGDVLRLRMSLRVSGLDLISGSASFRLEYAERETSCSAAVTWNEVGGVSSGAIWRGASTGVVDGTPLSGNPPTTGDLVLTEQDRAGRFEEENPSGSNPYTVFISEYVEYDWAIEHNGAEPATAYCFRMVYADGEGLDDYGVGSYPTLVTADFSPESRDWQWFGDGESITPIDDLAAVNTSPTDVNFDDLIKLRILVAETAEVEGQNIKFRLEFSESPSFTTSTGVVEIGDCEDGESLWCYAEGGGVDGAVIPETVLPEADSCPDGCGTHNQSGTSTSSFTHPAGAVTEYEFTLRHAGARPNTTYYFRLVEISENEPIKLSAESLYPSLSTKGAELIFTLSGLPADEIVNSVITTGVATTPTVISFGSLPFGQRLDAAQRKTIKTNAPGGFHLWMFATGPFSSPQGNVFEPIQSTNQSPDSWSSACPEAQSSCYGYRAGDDVLFGGSTRFGPDDAFAAFSQEPAEIGYSGQPVSNYVVDTVMSVEVSRLVPPGSYGTNLVYLVAPSF